jgi:hypothetical protein
MYKKKRRYKDFKGHTPALQCKQKAYKQQMATRRPQNRKPKPG